MPKTTTKYKLVKVTWGAKSANDALAPLIEKALKKRGLIPNGTDNQ